MQLNVLRQAPLDECAPLLSLSMCLQPTTGKSQDTNAGKIKLNFDAIAKLPDGEFPNV